ncbi:hypothetical protein LLEC1_04046 [Akanthomyces lecanii]|uniref:AB hydrolase-1 domain-containing protein n=1 Tax=Cordyceps confragosa TaxID=2714763 RepID=A0A179I112_CORDF|nr:hypothetical protein LLEC1_04046 [Akanthomyces lecanii]
MAELPPDPMLQLSADPSFHFEILRTMAMTAYEGADLGEVLVAAPQIVPGDFESFYAAFNTLASRVDRVAQSIDSKRHPSSARNMYFKAATYYASADFYLHGNWSDSRIYSLWDKHLSAFDAAMALMSLPGRRIMLLSKNSEFSIPAIFFTAGLSQRRPTLIIGNGFDGSQEEMYHVIGKAIIERGMNVITYEGPGQPTARRKQNAGFIADWERVVSPVVDWALKQPEIDPKAIGLLGYSLGGYLAPRAAAFDKRIMAVLAIDGVTDYGRRALTRYPANIQELYHQGRQQEFDEAAQKFFQQTNIATAARWAYEHGKFSFNTESPFELVTKRMAMNLEEHYDQIQVPVFVADVDRETSFPGQAKELADALGDRATYRLFTSEEGAGAHCSLGGTVLLNQVALDWFEDVLEAKNGWQPSEDL